MTTAEIQVLRNDLASLKADVREVSHLIEGMLAKLSAAHVELQDNVKRIVGGATKRIDRLPCMAARRKQWKRISR